MQSPSTWVMGLIQMFVEWSSLQIPYALFSHILTLVIYLLCSGRAHFILSVFIDFSEHLKPVH